MVHLSEKTVPLNPTDGVSGAKPEADGAAAENGGAATHKAAGAPRLPLRPRLGSGSRLPSQSGDGDVRTHDPCRGIRPSEDTKKKAFRFFAL